MSVLNAQNWIGVYESKIISLSNYCRTQPERETQVDIESLCKQAYEAGYANAHEAMDKAGVRADGYVHDRIKRLADQRDELNRLVETHKRADDWLESSMHAWQAAAEARQHDAEVAHSLKDEAEDALNVMSRDIHELLDGTHAALNKAGVPKGAMNVRVDSLIEMKTRLWDWLCDAGIAMNMVMPEYIAKVPRHAKMLQEAFDKAMEKKTELNVKSLERNDQGGYDIFLDGEGVKYLSALLAQPFLDKSATNYIEWKVDHPDTGPLAMTVQRLQGKSPHEFRTQAEAETKACHELFDDAMKTMGYEPAGPLPLLVDAIKKLQKHSEVLQMAYDYYTLGATDFENKYPIVPAHGGQYKPCWLPLAGEALGYDDEANAPIKLSNK